VRCGAPGDGPRIVLLEGKRVGSGSCVAASSAKSNGQKRSAKSLIPVDKPASSKPNVFSAAR